MWQASRKTLTKSHLPTRKNNYTFLYMYAHDHKRQNTLTLLPGYDVNILYELNVCLELM